MDRLYSYLNPIQRLGNTRYSWFFPLTGTLALAIFSEVVLVGWLRLPAGIQGLFAIFAFLAAIIYFAFRDGLKAGYIASIITIAYYFYIIFSRNREGSEFSSSIQTTIVLAALYAMIASIIGWLKQTIDGLIVQEKIAARSAENHRARLEAVLQQLPVGVMIVDNQGLKIESNRQMRLLFGNQILPRLEVGKKSNVNLYKNGRLLSPKDFPITRAIQYGEVIKAEELEYHKDEKRKYFLRVNASPIRNKQKQIIAAVSTIYDITHEKELEQNKNDFINIASHELKTPLTSMKLYLESLSKKVALTGDPYLIKTVTNVKNQTDRLQKIANELLDISRIQTGKMMYEKEVFRLDELIAEIVGVMAQMTKDHPLVVRKLIKATVEADKLRLYQVFSNLITNAIRYSPAHTKIIIGMKQIDKNVVVSVKDSGIGIPQSQHRKIFDRLYQVKDARRKTFPGLGMGLYISKEIIKKHNGKIWVESEEGKGSTFYFSLPTIESPL